MTKNNLKKTIKNASKKIYKYIKKNILIFLYLITLIVLSLIYYFNAKNKSITINGSFNNSTLYGFNGKAYINTNRINFLRGRLFNNNDIIVKVNGNEYEVKAKEFEIICDSVPYNDKNYASTPHQIEVKDSRFIVTPPILDNENHFHATKINITRDNNIDYEFLGEDTKINIKLDDVSTNVKIPNNKEIKVSALNTNILVNDKNVNNRLDDVLIFIDSDYTYSDFTIDFLEEAELGLFDYNFHFDGSITEMKSKLDANTSKILISSRAEQKEYKVDNNYIECYGNFNIDLHCDNNKSNFILFGNVINAKMGNIVLNSDFIQFIVENYLAIIIALVGAFTGLINTRYRND